VLLRVGNPICESLIPLMKAALIAIWTAEFNAE
jgi:hypothetical protein